MPPEGLTAEGLTAEGLTAEGLTAEGLTAQFTRTAQGHLDALTVPLVAALGPVARGPHPPGTFLLRFEVETQDYGRGFPVYWFPMDRSAMSLEGGTDLLPEVTCTVPEAVIEDPQYEAVSDGVWWASYALTFAWFGDCWRRAGGLDCPHPAFIALHDSSSAVDLRTGREVKDDAL